MTLIKLIICFFFGQFGVHKFMEKKIFLGILYLFTFGLFGIGWFLDLIIYFLDYMEEKKISHESYYQQNISDNTQDTQQKVNIEKKVVINEIKNYENSFLAEYLKTKQTKYYEGVNLIKEEREIDRRNYLSTYYGRLFIEKEKLIFSGTGIDFGICMADISFMEQYKNGIIIYTGVEEYAFACDNALKIYNLIESLKH